MKRIGNLRWRMASVISIGIIVSYFARISLNATASTLEHRFGITPWEMGILFSCYLWSYTLMQVPAGILLDKFGIKWVMRIGTIVWTIAIFLMAAVSGFWPLLLYQLLLGIGEVPTFPGAAKATGYWFPLKERGLATTSYDMGSKLASAIGLPLLVYMIYAFGWQSAFVLVGILSLIYCLIFWRGYRDPSEAKVLTKEEYNYIREGGAQEEVVLKKASGMLKYLLSNKKVWGLIIGFSAYNYAFNFFLSWLPDYLQNSLGISLVASGWYTAIPWGVGTLAEILIGGFFVDGMIKRGHNATRVRRALIIIGMLISLASIGATFTHNVNIAIVWISIALCGLSFAGPIIWSIPALIAPNGTVGSLGSAMNMFGNGAAILAPIMGGVIVSVTHAFGFNFAAVSVILLIGILSFIFMLGNIEQLPMPPQRSDEVSSEPVEDALESGALA